MVAIVAVSSMIKVPMGTEAPSTMLLIVFFQKSLLLEKMNHDNVKFVCNTFTSIDKGTTVKARSKLKVERAHNKKHEAKLQHTHTPLHVTT